MRAIFATTLFSFFFSIISFSQNYKSVQFGKLATTVAKDEDTLFVRKISPENLKEIIVTEPKCLVFLYKPYCPGLKKGDFSAYQKLFSYCFENNIHVAFLAQSTNDLGEIATNFVNKYQLLGVTCYVIDTKENTDDYEKALKMDSHKEYRNIAFYENGVLMHSYWSYSTRKNIANVIRGMQPVKKNDK